MNGRSNSRAAASSLGWLRLGCKSVTSGPTGPTKVLPTSSQFWSEVEDQQRSRIDKVYHSSATWTVQVFARRQHVITGANTGVGVAGASQGSCEPTLQRTNIFESSLVAQNGTEIKCLATRFANGQQARAVESWPRPRWRVRGRLGESWYF